MANVLTVSNSGIISFDNRAYSNLAVPDLSTSARLGYDGGGGINITSYTAATTALDRFSVDGTQGRLFSVTDVLTGTLFSVNNITGLPILEVKDTNTVIAGKFNSNALVVSGTQVSIGNTPLDTTSKLSVSGNSTFVGNISSTEVIYASGGNSNSWINSKTLTQFTAIDNQPLSANFATLDTRISIAVLDFDDTTTESACFVGVIPEATVLTSGLQVRLTWTATNATTGNVRWGVQFMNLNTPLSADSFDAAAFTTTTTSSTSGLPSITTVTCTALDGMTAGSFYRMRVFRDSADTVNDTMERDAELVAVEVRSAA